MYKISRIEALRQKVQKEIEAVIEKHEPELQKIVESEVRPGQHVRQGMGTTIIVGKSNKYVAEEFTKAINNIAWRDAFDAGICIKDFDKQKDGSIIYLYDNN